MEPAAGLAPPPAAVEAFGGDPGDVRPVGRGASGTAWRAGGVVLKRGVAIADLVAWWDAPPSLLDEVELDLVRRACTYRLAVAEQRGEPHGYDTVLAAVRCR